MSSRTCLVSASLMICALMGACESGTDPTPLPAGKVSGTVTDVQGRPVAGASVSLVFGVDGVDLPGWEGPAKRIETTIRFVTDEPSHVTVEVFDHMGRHVRQLIEELLSAGEHSAVWDADDDQGQPVPLGLYQVVLQSLPDGAPEPMVAEQSLMLYDFEPGTLHDRPHAITDSKGHYEVELGLFPIGEPLVITDESGNPVGDDTAISDRVRFVATVEDEQGLRHASKYVTVENPTRPFAVDLRIR